MPKLQLLRSIEVNGVISLMHYVEFTIKLGSAIWVKHATLIP